MDYNTREMDTLNEGYKVSLSSEDLQCIYHPWKHLVIIKLLWKCVRHHYLRKKVQEQWKITENFPLIDLGADYYVVKFTKKKNLAKVMHQGLWFINENFLSVQKWESNFVASEPNPLNTAIWVRLPHLPTEFYDGVVLRKIGNIIGRLLRVDACTSATLRGRYARLCGNSHGSTSKIIYFYWVTQAIHSIRRRKFSMQKMWQTWPYKSTLPPFHVSEGSKMIRKCRVPR